MLTTFLIVFEQMMRILILLGTGFALNRLNLIPKATGQVLSRLVIMVFQPAIVLYTNLVECRVDSLAANRTVVLVGLAFCAVSMALAMLLSRRFGGGDPTQTGIYRYALSFPNTGAVATPLALAMSGTAGLFQLNLYLFFTGIFTYSWGVAQLQPAHARESLRAMMRKVINPVFLAMVIGLALGVLGVGEWLPGSVLEAMGSLGECYVPACLLVIGFSVGEHPIANAAGDRKVYLFTALRLLVIPGVFLLILRLLGAPDMVCLLTVLVYACPCGMNVVVYPTSYGQDCRTGLSMVLISSLASMLTVPVMYALATL